MQLATQVLTQTTAAAAAADLLQGSPLPMSLLLLLTHQQLESARLLLHHTLLHCTADGLLDCC
jgi:hypothetical protein